MPGVAGETAFAAEADEEPPPSTADPGPAETGSCSRLSGSNTGELRRQIKGNVCLLYPLYSLLNTKAAISAVLAMRSMSAVGIWILITA